MSSRNTSRKVYVVITKSGIPTGGCRYVKKGDLGQCAFHLRKASIRIGGCRVQRRRPQRRDTSRNRSASRRGSWWLTITVPVTNGTMSGHPLAHPSAGRVAAAAGGRVGRGRGGGGREGGVRGGSWMTGGGSVVMATHRSAAATRIESSRGHIAPRRTTPHHAIPRHATPHTADTCACGSRVRETERDGKRQGEQGLGEGGRKRGEPWLYSHWHCYSVTSL